MGRFYNGDIEGKFWFGVQSSDCASRFGGRIEEPNTIMFAFEKEDLEDVEKEIASIEKFLGKNKEKLDEFFKNHYSYNNEMLMQELGFTEKSIGKIIEDYADLLLGYQIRDCLKEKDCCYFEGEL